MNATLGNREILASSQTELADLESVSPLQVGGLGTWFLRDMWYFAVPSDKLKPGRMISKTMLGEPVLLLRSSDGSVRYIRHLHRNSFTLC